MGVLKLFFKGFHAGFKNVGYIISGIFNTLMFLLVFIFGIGMVSIFFKIMKKKLLDLKFNKSKNSYWVDKKNRNSSMEDSLKPY